MKRLLAFPLLLLPTLALAVLTNDTSEYLPPLTGTYHYNTFTPASGSFPAAGGTYVDPIFGATIRRVTSDYPTGTSGQDLYAHHWVNADGTAFFWQSTGGVKQVRRISDNAVLRASAPFTDQSSWHPTDPDKFFYNSGATLREYTVSTGTNTIIHTFPAAIGELGGSHDMVDRTGNFFVVPYDSGGNGTRVYRRDTDTIFTGTLIPTVTTGYIHITPGAEYVIRAQSGTFTAYPINTTTNTVGAGFPFWVDGNDHAGYVSASDGSVYMVHGDANGPNDLWIAKVKDQTGQTMNQIMADPANTKVAVWSATQGFHASGVGRGTFQNYVFVSTIYNGFDNFNSTPNAGNWVPYANEIMAVNVVTHDVLRFAHHRSRGLEGSTGYDSQPRVTTSWTGNVILWASNYNISDSGTPVIDAYMIQDPLGGGSSPPNLSGQATASRTSAGFTPSVITDGSDGTLYMVVVADGDTPSAAQIKAGQNSSGAAASASQSMVVSSSGTKTFAAIATLSANTAYDVWFVHTNASAQDSAAVKADAVTYNACQSCTHLPLRWNGAANDPLYQLAVGY